MASARATRASPRIICILLAYPLAYFIAFKVGRWRNLLLGLVMVPFFTSFLLRTIAWQSLFADNGPVLGIAETLHLIGLLDSLRHHDRRQDPQHAHRRSSAGSSTTSCPSPCCRST